MVFGIICIGTVEIIIRVGIGIIPGRIHIIISVIQLHDIPCMILAGMPFYIITGNPQLLHDILESPRVSCTYRSSIYQCTVCTLVHGCVLIIYNRIKNCIMHCCFLIIICIFSIGLIQNLLSACLKSRLCRIHLCCCNIKRQVDLSNASIRCILIPICCIHPEQFWVIIAYCHKSIAKLSRRNSLYRCKALPEILRIGIDLTVQRLTGIIKHLVIRIYHLIKGKSISCIALA